MNNSIQKKNMKRFSVKRCILTITTLPLLFACIMITICASWTMEKGMESEVFSGLKGAVTGALLSMDNVSRESFHLVGDELYKGDYNVTQNMDGLDYYAESNDVEITFFYDNIRRATTIKDKSGERLLGTEASPEVTEAVLERGEEYSSNDLVINEQRYYGYYMPVNDTEGNIVGMVFAGRANSQVFHYILTRILFIVIIAALIYIICMFVAVKVSRIKFLNPLARLTTAAEELARGNINQEIHKEYDDEFGDLIDTFQLLMGSIRQQANVAGRMAEGDLTVSYRPLSDQDVMGHAIENMIRDNNMNLTTINQVSDRMVAGVRGIATASNSLANGTTEQASAVEEIMSSIGGIAESAAVNARTAERANELVKETGEETVRSNDQMKHMISAIQDINDSAKNISNVMKLIDDIASQTNIISLNASVEASRAGVHGKGFAVVADEIRNLARKSTEAAQDSAVMIEDSIKKAAVGSKLAEETAESLDTILVSVQNMVSLMHEIAEASAAQSESVAQVNQGITQISDVVQTNSATSQQCAAASAELDNLAGELKAAVRRYKLSVNGYRGE